jgi:dihydroorotate dehydrogenase
MSEIDLTSQVGDFLKLRHPFWIASAHYSENEAVIRAWAEVRPAALTLKTAHRAPIDQETTETTRHRTTESMSRLCRSYYCDGPKQKELIPYEKAAELLKFARAQLPETEIGISVLCSAKQDYDELRTLCPELSFCELNLKYIFRFDKKENISFFQATPKRFDELLEQLRKFTAAFAGVPIFIKISRELAWLPGTKELDSFLEILSKHGKAGLIIANSLKLDIPEYISNGKERVLRNGVVCGESLFDHTISLIDSFRVACEARKIPIVATGGMIDPEHVLMALRAGASAVQLCTAFDYNRLNYYNTLCWNLQNRVEVLGLSSFSDYLERLRKESVATIYNMPFMYFQQFWSSDIQTRLLRDVRASEQMDVFVMSGRTVVEKWKDVLKQRFQKNLGFRLLLPNPEGPAYGPIQKSWGMTELELGTRKERVKNARKLFEELWKETEPDRKKNIKSGDQEAEFQVSWSDQCPFYSFYLFDDKVYVAPYPFIRPGEPNIPVYVFFAGSPEYERIKKEARTLLAYGRQTSI